MKNYHAYFEILGGVYTGVSEQEIKQERLAAAVANLERLGEILNNLPRGREVEVHADLRRIAVKKFVDGDLSASLQQLSVRLPRGGEAEAHAHLRQIAEGNLRGLELSKVLVAFGRSLPRDDKVGAHADLRRIAHANLQGPDLINAICFLDSTSPEGGERITEEEHATLRGIAETITDAEDSLRSLGNLGLHLPRGGEVAAHIDLCRIHKKRRMGPRPSRVVSSLPSFRRRRREAHMAKLPKFRSIFKRK